MAAVVHPCLPVVGELTNTFANPNAGDLQNEAMRNGFVDSIGSITCQSANITVDGSGDAKGAVFARSMCIAMKRDFNRTGVTLLSVFELNATAYTVLQS